MEKTFLFMFLFASSYAFSAGNVVSADVDFVRVDASGKGYVQFLTDMVGDANGLPTCASSYPRALSFDTATPGGQAILSLVLSAKMSGKKVRAYGKGVCTNYSVMEDWYYGFVK